MGTPRHWGVANFSHVVMGALKDFDRQLRSDISKGSYVALAYSLCSPQVELEELHVGWNIHFTPCLVPLGNSDGNLGNPLGMLSYNGMNNLPFHLASIDFSSAKISFVGRFFPYRPSNFVIHRMGLCEWMAWMCVPMITHPPFIAP